MKILISGGAGYIGSTIASACLDAGITPVLLDSLITGRREYTEGRLFYEGDIADGTVVDHIFADHPDIEAAVHCAALTVVPDSVSDPLGYYIANVTKSLSFVTHLLRNRCGRLIFSSSASLYEPGEDFSVDESSPISPQSPYGRTKAHCEALFADVSAAHPLRTLSLRYFNPIGADPWMRTGLQYARPSHALGKMLEAREAGTPFIVTGTDYATRDGSGIRDYIHVWDLAAAHVQALRNFDTILTGAADTPRSTAINLGTGRGTTVFELLDAFNEVTGAQLTSRETGRRPGDVAGAYARSERAAELLGLKPEFTLRDAIRHALQWAPIREGMLEGAAAQHCVGP
ncbi:UDP-glucose 4-epimerase [Streptomyces hundungensis]|uniref:UDP-glucose 4-epimerase n=1 Tax=Streptomyces hundungensis TaxID=1077946 RepID=A0A387H404_9ACTN|nr:UDP-glucose 4-epimerase GalE [Streptomyces hundungensis]AYG78435.1 UDP-glucose 4-epimerase [Streptomyces hundungensis]